MFAEGKSFPHSAGYTIGNSAQFFPHVENPVENVQKSSLYAHFPGEIPQFPPSFQQQLPPYLGKSLTICKIQVGIMTIF